MTTQTETAAGRFRLRVEVPADMMSSAVEEDDDHAAETLAMSVGLWLPPSAPPGTREGILDQLAAARAYLRGNGASWFGVTTGPIRGRRVMVLVSIAVTEFDSPPGVPAEDVLARMLTDQYPHDAALVETFRARRNPGVGIRRLDAIELPPRTLTVGVSQILIIYDPPGALGVITGLSLDPADIDLTAILISAIARTMRVTAL